MNKEIEQIVEESEEATISFIKKKAYELTDEFKIPTKETYEMIVIFMNFGARLMVEELKKRL